MWQILDRQLVGYIKTDVVGSTPKYFSFDNMLSKKYVNQTKKLVYLTHSSWWTKDWIRIIKNYFENEKYNT